MLKELLESLDHQELVASQETLAHLDHLDYRSVTATPSILLCACVRACVCVLTLHKLMRLRDEHFSDKHMFDVVLCVYKQ